MDFFFFLENVFFPILAGVRYAAEYFLSFFDV